METRHIGSLEVTVFIPFFPLASGVLTGKYTRGASPSKNARLAQAGPRDRFLSDRNRRIARALGDFAASRGHTLLELAVSWLACQPAVRSVITGATKPEQVHANAEAAGWRLTRDELSEIDRIAPHEEKGS